MPTTGMKRYIKKKTVYDLDSVLFFVKVGLHITEFYSSMYALYVANGDPAIGVTLTAIHNMVSANSYVFTVIKSSLFYVFST